MPVIADSVHDERDVLDTRIRFVRKLIDEPLRGGLRHYKRILIALERVDKTLSPIPTTSLR